MRLALSDYEKPQREHYELLEPCRRKDPETVARFLTRRIESTSESLLADINRNTSKTIAP